MLSTGTKVKVINQTFANAWEKSGQRNVWVIDHIKPKDNKEPTLYVCVPENGKTMYQFQEHELKEIENDMTNQEKIEKIKNLANEHSAFVIPDNCVGDGWTGSLEYVGAYCYGNNHFEGEFFKYEEMDEELLDTILDEAIFQD